MSEHRVPLAYINRQYNCSGPNLNPAYLDAYFDWLEDWPDGHDIYMSPQDAHSYTGCYDCI